MSSRVEAFDSALRFLVTSDSQRAGGEPIKHVVDLGEFKGNGRCSCQHFDFRFRPGLTDGTIEPGPKSRCKHIEEAREFLIDALIEKLTGQ